MYAIAIKFVLLGQLLECGQLRRESATQRSKFLKIFHGNFQRIKFTINVSTTLIVQRGGRPNKITIVVEFRLGYRQNKIVTVTHGASSKAKEKKKGIPTH